MSIQSKSFEDMMERFRSIAFVEQFDIVVAIANGGIVPAAILNQRLNIEYHLLKINLRDNNQKPKYESPQLMSPINFEFNNKKILLVEDRIKTGASVRYACQLLEGAKLIKTFAVNGDADYSLYNEDCFKFPWIV